MASATPEHRNLQIITFLVFSSIQADPCSKPLDERVVRMLRNTNEFLASLSHLDQLNNECSKKHFSSQLSSPSEHWTDSQAQLNAWIDGDILSWERTAFPETTNHPQLYSCLRNWILLNWLRDPSRLVEPGTLHCDLRIRGLIRIFVLEVLAPRILREFTKRGLINFGFPLAAPRPASARVIRLVCVGAPERAVEQAFQRSQLNNFLMTTAPLAAVENQALLINDTTSTQPAVPLLAQQSSLLSFADRGELDPTHIILDQLNLTGDAFVTRVWKAASAGGWVETAKFPLDLALFHVAASLVRLSEEETKSDEAFCDAWRRLHNELRGLAGAGLEEVLVNHQLTSIDWRLHLAAVCGARVLRHRASLAQNSLADAFEAFSSLPLPPQRTTKVDHSAFVAAVGSRTPGESAQTVDGLSVVLSAGNGRPWRVTLRPKGVVEPIEADWVLIDRPVSIRFQEEPSASGDVEAGFCELVLPSRLKATLQMEEAGDEKENKETAVPQARIVVVRLSYRSAWWDAGRVAPGLIELAADDEAHAFCHLFSVDGSSLEVISFGKVATDLWSQADEAAANATEKFMQNVLPGANAKKRQRTELSITRLASPLALPKSVLIDGRQCSVDKRWFHTLARECGLCILPLLELDRKEENGTCKSLSPLNAIVGREVDRACLALADLRVPLDKCVKRGQKKRKKMSIDEGAGSECVCALRPFQELASAGKLDERDCTAEECWMGGLQSDSEESSDEEAEEAGTLSDTSTGTPSSRGIRRRRKLPSSKL